MVQHFKTYTHTCCICINWLLNHYVEKEQAFVFRLYSVAIYVRLLYARQNIERKWKCKLNRIIVDLLSEIVYDILTDYTNAYIYNIMYYWRFKEPIQFNFVIFNDVLQQHTQINDLSKPAANYISWGK